MALHQPLFSLKITRAQRITVDTHTHKHQIVYTLCMFAGRHRRRNFSNFDGLCSQHEREICVRLRLCAYCVLIAFP